MSADHGCVHEVQVPVDLACRLRLGLQRRQDAVPHARGAPTVEAARDRPTQPIARRQVAPGRTGAQNPQNTIDNAPMRRVRMPRPGLLRRQVRLQSPPLRVGQITSSHSTYMESRTRNVSPLQTRPSSSTAIVPSSAIRSATPRSATRRSMRETWKPRSRRSSAARSGSAAVPGSDMSYSLPSEAGGRLSATSSVCSYRRAEILTFLRGRRNEGLRPSGAIVRAWRAPRLFGCASSAAHNSPLHVGHRHHMGCGSRQNDQSGTVDFRIRHRAEA